MTRPLQLLIVDDEPTQLALMQTLVSELALPHRCHYVSNGPSALDFLEHRSPFQSAPRPQLILLDVNMPGMSGCEVLRIIKANPEFRTIPVIMLSNSKARTDVEACYREHANAYIRKPPDLQGNLSLLRSLHSFWAELAMIA